LKKARSRWQRSDRFGDTLFKGFELSIRDEANDVCRWFDWNSRGNVDTVESGWRMTGIVGWTTIIRGLNERGCEPFGRRFREIDIREINDRLSTRKGIGLGKILRQ
jgi:hypothetical protein